MFLQCLEISLYTLESVPYSTNGLHEVFPFVVG